MYVVLSVYFASVMIRLLLVLGPASCVASGIGISFVFRNFSKSIRQAILGEDIEKLRDNFNK
jgi:dolichyl-diphosphooligosaccharide--protein glycosyltransferase